MIAMLLNVIPHPVFGRDQSAGVAVAAEVGVAINFLEGSIEARDSVSDRRHVVR